MAGLRAGQHAFWTPEAKKKKKKQIKQKEEVQISRPPKSREFLSPRQDPLLSMREQGGEGWRPVWRV